jgi:hypothetical protein
MIPLLPPKIKIKANKSRILNEIDFIVSIFDEIMRFF